MPGSAIPAPGHRSAEEIGRTAAGPRPLPAARRHPRGAAARRGRTPRWPNGLRVLAAHRPGVPMAELRLRVPVRAGDAPEHSGRRASCSRATLLTGTATRDRVAIDDELAARRRRPRRRRRPGAAPDRRLRARRGPARRARRARRRPHRRHAPRRRGRPRARPARRADHGGPRPAAHDRPGGVAAQAVRRPPDHPGDADGAGRRRRHAPSEVRALQRRVARAAGVDPHAGRRRRPAARRSRDVEKCARRLDGRRTRPAS